MRLDTPDFIGIEERRRHLQGEWARFFECFDVVLSPPAPTGAIRHDQTPDPHARVIEVNGRQRPYFDLMPWACLATGAGLPAAVAPVLLAEDGLPRGVQIIAAAHEDRTAIALRRDARSDGLRLQGPANGFGLSAKMLHTSQNG